MLNCKQATELASKSLDMKLPLRQKISLKLHLMMCSLCRAYEKQLKLIKRISPKMDAYIENQTQHSLSSTAKKRIKDKLKG
ncbi:zf-HC2 domain-containing protein [Pseudomonadota bacterium]